MCKKKVAARAVPSAAPKTSAPLTIGGLRAPSVSLPSRVYASVEAEAETDAAFGAMLDARWSDGSGRSGGHVATGCSELLAVVLELVGRRHVRDVDNLEGGRVRRHRSRPRQQVLVEQRVSHVESYHATLRRHKIGYPYHFKNNQ